MPNATVRANAQTLSEACNYWHRFADLEIGLRDVVVWMSILDHLVDEMDCPREIDLAFGQIMRVTEALKQAVADLDQTYHQRSGAEAAQ